MRPFATVPELDRFPILVIDDDEDDFLIIQDLIHRIPNGKFEVEWCHDFHLGLRKACQNPWGINFVDHNLGAHTGMELLREARLQNCESPIILLTGTDNRELDLEAIHLGAADYLVKSELTVEKLERCIRYAIDRRDSLMALRENEQKYRSIFEKSKDLVFISDEELHFQEVNNAALELTGYTPDELKGQDFCDLIANPEDRQFLKDSMQKDGEVNDWEVALQMKSGEKKICILTATKEQPHYTSGFIQGILHDITILRRQERLTLQSEKLAATSRLVRALAHEVRNPLNNITLSAEQLQQDVPLSEAGELYLSIIQRNAQRISDLISELLTSSKPSEVVLRKSSLQAIVDEVIAASIDRITLKKIRLEIQFPDQPVMVLADPEKLSLALLNVMTNAIEAVEEGKGRLAIAIQLEPDAAILQIEDNGCGISEENLARLFEPYFTQKRNGMGLGLPFTRNILQAHRATIDVSSELHSGTRFSFSFPRHFDAKDIRKPMLQD